MNKVISIFQLFSVVSNKTYTEQKHYIYNFNSISVAW